MFKIIGTYVSPSPLMVSPVKWGDDAIVREWLQHGTVHLQTTKRRYPMRYPFSPPEVVEFFRVYCGPVNQAFAALDIAGQYALRRDLGHLWKRNNRGHERLTHVESEYLEVVAHRAEGAHVRNEPRYRGHYASTNNARL